MTHTQLLVTGGAGFIGSHLVEALLENPAVELYCLDNFSDYYDPVIKRKNIQHVLHNPRFHLVELDIATTPGKELLQRFNNISFEAIVHLAARAGVRPSLIETESYYETNVTGTLHLLDFARFSKIPRFIFASSSSVYGNNPNVPWKESDLLHQPVSPYGATKLAAEELGFVYASLYPVQFIALRLFTVYGPRQRPDLAIHGFYNQLSKGWPIRIFGDGHSSRDYTFVTDTVAGILAALNYTGTDNPVINLGDNRKISLLQLVDLLEKAMGTKAIIDWQPPQPGDVQHTCADIQLAGQLLGYKPTIMLEEGITRFVDWKKHQLCGSPIH